MATKALARSTKKEPASQPDEKRRELARLEAPHGLHHVPRACRWRVEFNGMLPWRVGGATPVCADFIRGFIPAKAAHHSRRHPHEGTFLSRRHPGEGPTPLTASSPRRHASLKASSRRRPHIPHGVIPAKARLSQGVIPAKAGIPLWFSVCGARSWTPAFAGVTPLKSERVTPANVGDASCCTVEVAAATRPGFAAADKSPRPPAAAPASCPGISSR